MGLFTGTDDRHGGSRAPVDDVAESGRSLTRRAAVALPLLLAFAGCTAPGADDGVAGPTATPTSGEIVAEESDPDPEPEPEPEGAPAVSGLDMSAYDDGVEEYIERIALCIEAEGIAVRRFPDGSLQPLPSDAMEEDQRRRVLEGCSDEYTPEGPEVTPAFLGRWYDELLVAAECLRAQGVSVPEAPSREQFIESPSWHPHASAGQAAGYSATEARAFRQACPEPDPR